MVKEKENQEDMREEEEEDRVDVHWAGSECVWMERAFQRRVCNLEVRKSHTMIDEGIPNEGVRLKFGPLLRRVLFINEDGNMGEEVRGRGWERRKASTGS